MDVDFEVKHLPPIQSQIEAVARKVAEAEQGVARIAVGARRLVEESKAHPPANLDEIIRDLEKLESANSARLEMDLRPLSRARKTLGESRNSRFRLKALTLLGRFEGLLERFEESRIAKLEALRDARWELMALRSELHRGQEQSIEFDGTRSLRELLGSLKS